MKFNCGLSRYEKEAIYVPWRPFYPFFPRKVGPKDCRAFEWIERRSVRYGGYWFHSYRMKP